MKTMKTRLSCCLLLLLVLSPADCGADALDKLDPERLERVRQAIQQLRESREPVPRRGEFAEHRANLHVHSHWSHDSQGTIDEIVVAAKAVGTSVLLFTEHPAKHYDFLVDGHRGTRDGVLMIPGAEMNGFLTWPTISLRDVTPTSPQELADLVLGREGQIFVSHLEERMDWQIQGVTGTEIYNTHADFKEEKRLLSALKNPIRMMQLADVFRRYPQESFAALQKYPQDYLKRWDQLCQLSAHTGISANDAHQNIGIVVRWIEGNRGRLEDAAGKPLIDVDLSFVPDSEQLRQNRRPGDVISSLYLDPYEVSLRHVGTHLLLTELSESAVRDCLDAGRCFVAFDWIADSTGFNFAAVVDSVRSEMGSQISMESGMLLTAQAPLPVEWRLMKDGQCVAESQGRTFEFPVEQAAVYRTEAWLNVAGERTIWILSNPIYVSTKSSSGTD